MPKQITVIQHTPKLSAFEQRCRRVAVYARVSTQSDEQLNSIEAQKSYYLQYVANHPEWTFFNLYSDDGITGTSYKNRTGFNRMIDDALAGKFDLIITKSLSRFARNTVDSLVSIRKLKENGIEVYFEKEDVWTFDGKGEFILTLLSSFAQEESRSISENVTWGQRKRFADGKYQMPYARFLGYDRGLHGEIVVNQSQAILVRLIFKLFLEGKTPSSICRYLDHRQIPTPGGKQCWSQSVVSSILQNVKYKGDALLQKQFTVDFLTKKKKQNEGELPQYYITEGHEAIIPVKTFDYTQEILCHRKQIALQHYYGSSDTFSSKIICAYCGAFFGKKNWHSTTTRDAVWQCNRLYADAPKCQSPYIYDIFLEYATKTAFQYILRKNTTLQDIAINLLERALPDTDNDNCKNQLTAIQNHIQQLISGKKLVDIPNDVITVCLDRILATTDKRLIFRFIDGTEYTFDLRQHHMDSMLNHKSHYITDR